MQNDLLIEIVNLEKNFASSGLPVSALKGVNLEVRRGEFLAIQGASGCGKSTLLSIMGLLDTASGGIYRLCGQDVNQLSQYQQALLRNRHIGWVFQSFNLISDMTVLENVILPLRYHKGMKRKDYHSKALAALGRVDMTDKIDNYPGQLSGGQQQRVAIARALVTEPDLLLADEPTGNLDSDNAERVFNVLQQLHTQGVSLIMVTHAPELARRCQRLISMSDGKVVNTLNSEPACQLNKTDNTAE
jgi:putative ABC transport system ATP-binding protein